MRFNKKRKRGATVVVAFCGHSNVAGAVNLEEELESVVEQLTLQGAHTFLLGGYGQFDNIAASVVKKVKIKFPDISSVLVIPYLNKAYNQSGLYDFTQYPDIENVPPKFAILKRNQCMVDEADVVVAYIHHTFGGAYKTYQYALRKKKRIVFVCKKDDLIYPGS